MQFLAHLQKSSAYIEALCKSLTPEDLKFYSYQTDRNDTVQGIRIYQDEFFHFLNRLGFYRYDLEEKFTLVHIFNKVIREVRPQEIQDTVKQVIAFHKEFSDDSKLIIRKMIEGSRVYFGMDKLSWLPSCNHFDFQKSESRKAYLYFTNGFLEITDKGFALKGYQELQGLVWAEQIKPHAFTAIQQPGQGEDEYHDEECVFYLFLRRLTHIERLSDDENHDRMLSLCTLLGYLAHDFTDTKLQAINFTDSRLSDDPDENNGRTGKSLIMKALSHITAVAEIDGKAFDPNYQFCYESVSVATKLVAFNDTHKKFSLESIYTGITEGYNVNKKFKGCFLAVAKTLITSNRPLVTNGESDRDRVVEFEVSEYFSAHHTPSHEFAYLKKEGRDNYWFFRDWDADQWNRFYNFFAHCIYRYFYNGVIRPAAVTLHERKLRNEVKAEFIQFMQSYPFEFSEGSEWCKPVFKDDFRQQFEKEYSDYLGIKTATITNWLKKYVKHGQRFADINEGKDQSRTSETANKHYFRLSKPMQQTATSSTTNS